jgi:hypothetical protein
MTDFFHPDHALRSMSQKKLVDWSETMTRSAGLESQKLLAECKIL